MDGSGVRKEESLRMARSLGLRTPASVTMGPDDYLVEWFPPDERSVFARVIRAGVVMERMYLPPGGKELRIASVRAAIRRSPKSIAVVQEDLHVNSSLMIATRDGWTYGEWNRGQPSRILVDGEIFGAVLMCEGHQVAVEGSMTEDIRQALREIDETAHHLGSPLLTEAATDDTGTIVLEAKPLHEGLLPDFGAIPELPLVATLPPPGPVRPISLDLPGLDHYEDCCTSRDVTVVRGALLGHLATYAVNAGYGLRRTRPI